jgi:hypothetical protein
VFVGKTVTPGVSGDADLPLDHVATEDPSFSKIKSAGSTRYPSVPKIRINDGVRDSAPKHGNLTVHGTQFVTDRRLGEPASDIEYDRRESSIRTNGIADPHDGYYTTPSYPPRPTGMGMIDDTNPHPLPRQQNGVFQQDGYNRGLPQGKV